MIKKFVLLICLIFMFSCTIRKENFELCEYYAKQNNLKFSHINIHLGDFNSKDCTCIFEDGSTVYISKIKTDISVEVLKK